MILMRSGYRRRERQIRCPHALEEWPLLALEVIGLAAADSARADVERCIEQQRQVGLEPLLDLVSQRLEQRAARAAAAALVGEGGIGESVADDPAAGQQRGPDDFVEVPSASSEHQQRFDFG